MKSPLKESSSKSTIKIARRELTRSPLKNIYKRRKSQTPLQLMEFIKNNELIQNKQDSTKNSYKCDFSDKKNMRKMINGSIPEESENSSNNNKYEKNRTDKKENKNEVGNNNYYIHCIKNVYENESHFNKGKIFESDKKINNENFLKFVKSNKNIRPSYKRRNSALNKNYLKTNFNNINIILDRKQFNSKEFNSIVNKKINAEIGSIIHKNHLEGKEIEFVKANFNTSSNNKNKSKKKDKKKNKKKGKDLENDKEKEKNLENDKIIKNEENNKIPERTKNNDDINNIKKVKHKNIIENEKKEEIEINTANTKINKKNKFKKFLCCFLNNGDSSFENN